MKQRKDAKKAEPDTHGRLKEIIAILKKYDYDDGLTPEITASILEDLGPTFVKIGQIASQQSEYIPPEYCAVLAKLRSKVAPMDSETVHAQIEKHLGKPAEELFTFFDETPLGSASIAQVHKAGLADGKVVAVKVRRPGVVDTVARDFALLEKVLDKFVKDDKSGNMIKGMISELEKTSKIELDFTNEAGNLTRFKKNNRDREGIESPGCYPELTCEAVLTEDFASGKEVSDAEFLGTLSEEERERIASLIADNFASQVLTDGFYHADPHSGNVFIKEAGQRKAAAAPAADGEEGAEEKMPLPDHNIEWIDFGMMGELNPKQRQLLIDIVTAVVLQDAYGLKRAVLQVAKPRGEINHGSILEMCENMCGEYNGSDFGDFDLGDLLSTILGGLEEANFEVDPFITNLARGIIAMEGTISTLCPTINILNFFMDKVNAGLDFNIDLEHPENMNPQIAMKLMMLLQGVTDSSTKTAEALDMLEKGQIKARADLGLEEKTERSVQRFTGFAARALIIAALFIGSCLLCTVPLATGENLNVSIIFPMLGFIGYVISIFFAWRLYRNIKKDK